MYIRNIRISDVRAFREVNLDLSRPDGSFTGWTVLAGRNGSGKSTLLKALALAVVGPEEARALQLSFADWIRSGSTKAEVEVQLHPSADALPEEAPPLPVNLLWQRKNTVDEPLLLPSELERAILDLLNDGLLPDGVRVDQVDSDGLWVFQNDVRLPLRELSDGYRTTAALVMDIVRHLHKCFGELKIERSEDEEGPFWKVFHAGVVLIDEIDLHLHISWQKRVGFWLKRHFPNIQFLVTTHSPFICQAADPRGLIRLPAPSEDRPVSHVSDDLYNTIVNGSIDDVILTELFGVESPYSAETERLREAVAQLEAKLQTGTATDQDRQKLRKLRSRLPRTMASSVEQTLRALTVEG